MTANIAINGFGRIGRCFLRAALKDKEFQGLARIVAINDLTDAKTLAHLFKYDSTFGKYEGDIVTNKDEIAIDGNKVKVLSVKDPSELPWKDLDIDLVVESTGKFNDAKTAIKHISAGASKVIISAPATNPDATILMGINDKTYDDDKHKIISMASCTTNCLAPVLKTINDNFGIESGYMTTCHAYTNDQRILDLPHKDLRRARAAMMSIIPTTTGAAKAIGSVIPELNGKMDGIMGYTEEPIVSQDIIGESHSSIVDGLSTMVLGGKSNLVKVMSWYDNEWSFACRLVDLVKFVVRKMQPN